ncbi:hypothetical protein DFQ26_000639, partial [Actinomortierella ambigua]
MGQSGLWPFLRELGIVGTSVNPKTIPMLQVDLPAVLFNYTTKMDFHILKRLLRREAPYQTDDEIQAERLCRLTKSLDKKLSETFDKGSAILHVDGPYTQQKQHAHSDRLVERQAQIDDLQTKIELVKAETQAIEGGKRPLSRRGCRRRLQRLYRRAMAAWRRTFRVSPELRAALAASLADRGWTVCQCHGEADVCVARLAADQAGKGPIHAATSDSDFLMYENVVVVRQDPKRRSQYSLFPADLIGDLNRHLPTFKKGKKRVPYPLMVPEVWKVIAIVNGNDYSPGVKGYGLRSLWRVL